MEKLLFEEASYTEKQQEEENDKAKIEPNPQADEKKDGGNSK